MWVGSGGKCGLRCRWVVEVNVDSCRCGWVVDVNVEVKCVRVDFGGREVHDEHSDPTA